MFPKLLAVSAIPIWLRLAASQSTTDGNPSPTGPPQYSNSISLTGFNLSAPVSSSNTNTDSDWQLDIDVYQVSSDFTLTTLALTFPADQLSSSANNTLLSNNWQLCGSVVGFHSTGGLLNGTDNNNGSCVPYFGQACVDAWTQAYLTARLDPLDYCQDLPAFDTFTGCNATDISASVGTFPLTNMTTMNGNGTTGLQSGEVFYSLEGNQFPDAATTAAQLNVVGLSLSPNQAINNNVVTDFTANVRLLCGKAARPISTMTMTTTTPSQSTSMPTSTTSSSPTHNMADTIKPTSFGRSVGLATMILAIFGAGI